MGTRNLTMVLLGGEIRVAQYGQWDGYPAGHGATVLEFLKTADLKIFAEKVSKCRPITQDDADRIGENWVNTHPHLSRDAGADILQMIMDAQEPLLLKISTNFVKDSLFNEYSYLIDLDTNTLEFYEGFQHGPLGENQRFDGPANEGGYYPIRCVGKWSFDDLPDVAGLEAVLESDED